MATQVNTLRMEQKLKKTPAGEVPVDWDVQTIGALAKTFLNGGTPSRKVEKYWKGDIPWITGADFGNQRVAVIRRHITKEAVEASATNVVPKGALLVVTRTGVGKLAIAPCDIAISQDITGVIPDPRTISSEFLFWQLDFYADRLKAAHQGTSINGILRDDLINFALPVPPIREQEWITDVLFAVEDAIDKTASVIKKTKEFKKGLLRRLLTKGIGHKRFKRSEIGDIPQEWQVVPLQELAEIERGKFQHRPRNEPRFYGGKYPFVQTGDVTNAGGRIREYTQTLNEEGLAISRLFPKGTIIITIAANIGETAITEFDVAFPDSLIGITATTKIDNRFLEYYLRTRKTHLSDAATQSAQKNINLETLRPYPVPLPPKREQVCIAETLESVEEEERTQAETVVKFQRLKLALMRELLAGRIRVQFIGDR